MTITVYEEGERPRVFYDRELADKYVQATKQHAAVYGRCVPKLEVVVDDDE